MSDELNREVQVMPRAWIGLGVVTGSLTPDVACGCYTCADGETRRSRMILCPTCGNKRCPRATHHDNACTGSNEPGQVGSRYA